MLEPLINDTHHTELAPIAGEATSETGTRESGRVRDPRRPMRHIVALKCAAAAVARHEYQCELWQLTQAQQRICEGLAATAVGAYMQAEGRFLHRSPGEIGAVAEELLPTHRLGAAEIETALG